MNHESALFLGLRVLGILQVLLQDPGSLVSAPVSLQCVFVGSLSGGGCPKHLGDGTGALGNMREYWESLLPLDLPTLQNSIMYRLPVHFTLSPLRIFAVVLSSCPTFTCEPDAQVGWAASSLRPLVPNSSPDGRSPNPITIPP